MIDFYKKFIHFCDVDKIKPDLAEIYRYMGIKETPDENIRTLVENSLKKVIPIITPRAYFMFLPSDRENDKVDFGLFNINSHTLSKTVSNSKSCIMFAATVGSGIDRLISGHSDLSPTTALIYQAIGTEMIEKYCDSLCKYIEKEFDCYLSHRISPGYGDFQIEVQKKIFEILTPEKDCGITLTDSMIMRPSKSVTALCAVVDKECQDVRKCNICTNINCEYRKN